MILDSNIAIDTNSDTYNHALYLAKMIFKYNLVLKENLRFFFSSPQVFGEHLD